MLVCDMGRKALVSGGTAGRFMSLSRGGKKGGSADLYLTPRAGGVGSKRAPRGRSAESWSRAQATYPEPALFQTSPGVLFSWALELS